MPECRGCGVALAPHELELCEACWGAREREDEAMVAYEPICLEEGPDEAEHLLPAARPRPTARLDTERSV